MNYSNSAARYLIIILLLTVSGFSIAQDSNPRDELLLSFTGDLMAHSINYRMNDYSSIYGHIEDIILYDDLTFGNAEFPMDPSRPMASFPSFNIHPEYLGAFIEAGLDVFSLANNHIGDIGQEALLSTFRAAEQLSESVEKEIYFSGINSEPAEEYRITEINKNGWKIGFLAVTQKSNNPVDPDLLYQVDYTKKEETDLFIQWLADKTEAYDLFIVSYHGGVEYNFIPTRGKRTFFHALIDIGVDIVWSHHPHVIQEVEIVERTGSDGVILYSLGNFLSGQGRIIDEVLPEEEWSYTGDSAIIQLGYSPDDSGGFNLTNINPIPTANYITPDRAVIIYPLDDLVLQPLPYPWDEFYRERRRIMKGFFEKNIRNSDGTQSAL